MKINFHNTAAKAIVYLSIGILVLMICNQAVYLHMHKMADGKIIHHAHPFQKSDNESPFANHHHTIAEIIFFENLTIFIPFVLFFLYIILVARNTEFKKYWQKNHISAQFIYFHNKAPPSFLIFR